MMGHHLLRRISQFSRWRIKHWIILFPVFVFSACASRQNESSNHPNILFIMMDDLGYGQFGVNNDSLTTADFDPLFVDFVDRNQGYSPEKALEFSKRAIPTMTQLAKQGVCFTRAYASSSLCSPSRLGIATGVLQNRFGVYENGDGEERGFDPGAHLAEVLKKAGYQTAHIGKWHIGKRKREILEQVLERHDLPKDMDYYDVYLNHKEAYNEAEETGYYGSVVDEHHPLNNGFDYYFGYNTWASQFYDSTLVWENFEHAGKQKGYNTDVFTDKALAFIGKQLERKEPFYVQLHFHAVHDNLEPKAPDEYFDRFDSDNYDLNNFYAHVYGVDHNIQRIVDLLKSKDQFNNTLILFTSDNGAMAGGRHKGNKVCSPLPGNAPFSGTKGNLYQGGIRVPMFIHWPEGIQKPFTSDHLVSTLDILPTAIGAARGEVPDNIDGKNLIPILNDPDHVPIHDYLLWAGMHSTAWGFLIEKSTKDHYTERPFAPPAWVIIKDDYLLRFVGELQPGIYLDFMDGRQPVFELFDVGNDPAETSDLSGKMPEKVRELSSLFFKEFTQWPPPYDWEREKWEEMVRSKSLLQNNPRLP